MKSRARKFIFAGVLSLCVALLITGIALAVYIPIDYFDEAPPGGNASFLMADDTTPVVSGSFNGVTSIGERDVIVSLTSGSGSITSQSETVLPSMRSFTQFSASANASGSIQYQWDGNDGSSNLSYGLGNGNGVDLTDSGNNIAFDIEVYQASNPIQMSIVAYTDATHHSTYNLVTPIVSMAGHYNLLPLFGNFTTSGSAGPANFSQIRALTITVNSDFSGGSPGTVFGIEYVEAASRLDFGDVPVGYEQGSPAAHTADGGVRLGSNIDTENGPFSSTDAMGDNNNHLDDEDGVTPFGNWITQGSIYVDLEGVLDPSPRAACLNAWIDFGNDGAFDPSDQVLFMEQLDASDIGQQTPITFNLPTSLANQTVYARFRLRPEVLTFDGNCSNEPTFGPTGYREMGEVEDYQWTFDPTAITVSSLQAHSSSLPAMLVLVATVLLGLGALGLFAFAKRRRI